MEYLSTTTFESKLAPGVKFQLRKMSHGRRMQFNLQTADVLSKILELQRDLAPVEEEIERAERQASMEPCTCEHPIEDGKDPHVGDYKRCSVAGCKCREPQPDSSVGDYEKRDRLQGQIFEQAITKLYPAYVRWGVSKIEGLSIDGEPATIETLLEDAPEALVTELGREISKVLKLTPEEVMGFKLPTTSGAAVDGPVSDTTAPSANPLVSTSSETAAATSQS